MSDRQPEHFLVNEDSSVMLRCPDCEHLLWLNADLVDMTLGDVIQITAGHECAADSNDDCSCDKRLAEVAGDA